MYTDSDSSYGSRAVLHDPQTGQAPHEPGLRYYQPGTPIGYLAARGTPYEHKFLTKKLGFCCMFLAPVITLITLIITLVPVLWAVAEHTLHTSVLKIHQANLSMVDDSSFALVIDGEVTKAGIFPAHLYFREPMQVFWMQPPTDGQPMRERNLGQMRLSFVGVAAGHGKISQATHFNITDHDAFAQFSRALMTQEEFTWRLTSSRVQAVAFSFLPAYKDFKYDKHVVFKGINNFGNDIKLVDFQLPGDAPGGGILMQATTILDNPSPFGVQIGYLSLDLFYRGVYMGEVSTQGLNMVHGPNTVTIAGTLVSLSNNETALEIIGQLFSAYINGDVAIVEAKGNTVKQNDGSVVKWLSTGIHALDIQVPMKSPAPINPIKGIQLDHLSLLYNKSAPFSPLVSSDRLIGQIALPFGFSINISRISTSLEIDYMGANVGSVRGSYARSSITTLQRDTPGQTVGTLDLTLEPSPLMLPNTTDAARNEFIAYEDTFVFGDQTDFQVTGMASALTETPIGDVLLDRVKFDVATNLRGLQGLTRYPTVVKGLDLVGGTHQGLSLNVTTQIVNPSNLNLSLGSDAVFQLVNVDVLGNITLPNLKLGPGNNTLQAVASFDANRSPRGAEMLDNYVSGIDTLVNITGFSGSSTLPSLLPSLEKIRLHTEIPGMHSPLIQSARLLVTNTTDVMDNMALSTVRINNPFTSPLHITRVAAKVASHGIHVADIDAPLSFVASGKGVTTSPEIPLALNLNPSDIFALLRALALESGQDVAPFDGIVKIAGYKLSPTTSDDSSAPTRQDLLKRQPEVDVSTRKSSLYIGFDLPDFVTKAFSIARTDLYVMTDVTVGDYSTSLNLTQKDVKLITDETLLKLLPPLARPIVQKLVDTALLNMDSVILEDVAQDGFMTAIKGSIVNAGPFDASIAFPEGLSIFWDGRELVKTMFPNITLLGDVGAKLDLTAQVTVSDTAHLADFTSHLLHDKDFIWTIKAKGIKVAALGIEVANVTMTKEVQLSGFNGFKDAVVIKSFDLPSNDPLGGIHFTALTSISSPSQVGVQLSRFGVNLFSKGILVGPSQASSAFTLHPLSTSDLALTGRLVRQESEAGLAMLSEIVSKFVHDQDSTVDVEGAFAGSPEVTWLNDGIKSLEFSVDLPAQKFDVIRKVSLNQLSLFFTEETAWAPSATTNNTSAAFFLPFGFPVNIVQSGGTFVMNSGGKDIAALKVPLEKTVTDASRTLTLEFDNIPLKVYDGAHAEFSAFLAHTAQQSNSTFQLHGSADSRVDTAAGLLTVNDIPFSVADSVGGLQNLNARPTTVSALDVAHGYKSYLEITTSTGLYNPSPQLTVGAGDVAFDLYFNDRPIGNAQIANVVLKPGQNTFPIHYAPQSNSDVAAGRVLLENYVQNVTSKVFVQGSDSTTPIQSLKKAFGGIRLDTSIAPLQKLLVLGAKLEVPKEISQNGLVTTTVTIANPFSTTIYLKKIQANATYYGDALASLDQDLGAHPIVIPGHKTATSSPIITELNTDPKSLIRFIFDAAERTHTDLGPLPRYFQRVLDMPDTTTAIKSFPDVSEPPCSSGKAFDTFSAVRSLLRGLATTIDINTNLSLDEYNTDLSFRQAPVPTVTDDTALYLIGPVAAPLLQLIVNDVGLKVQLANATSLTNDGFDVSLVGSLSVDAPADAFIEFPKAVTVVYKGQAIASMELPSICSAAGAGVPDLKTKGRLSITNQDRFASFAQDILHEPEFQWTLMSKIAVRTLGIRFTNVHFEKNVTLQGFNNLPDVKILSFDIPSQDDAARALNIVTDTTIESPSSLGIQLDTARFALSFQGTSIGPAQSSGLFIKAKSSTKAQLTGKITHKSADEELSNIGVLFSRYLSGAETAIQVVGDSITTHAQGGEVTWLTKAFKTLSLNVVLPGKVYQLIHSITISDLTASITGDPAKSYSVETSSTSTVATFSNPFHFDLSVAEAATTIEIVYQEKSAGHLKLPATEVSSATSTGPEDIATLVLSFSKQQLVADDHSVFQQYLAATADERDVKFGLRGSSDVFTKIVIGDVRITGVPFDLKTSISGMNSFGHVGVTSDVVLRDAQPDHLDISLMVTLNNPSNISLSTTDVSLPVFFNNYEIGRTKIADLQLKPGRNVVPTTFSYQPKDRNSSTAQEVLTAFVQPKSGTRSDSQKATLEVRGRLNAKPPLTPYESLEPSMAGVSLETVLQGIGSRIIKIVRVSLDVLKICNGADGKTYVNATMESENQLPLQIALKHIDSTIQRSGDEKHSPPYSLVDYRFNPPFILKPALAGGKPDGSTVGAVEGVKIPNLITAMGLIGSTSTIFSVIETVIGSGDSGYLVPGLHYDQWDVETDVQVMVGTRSVDGIPEAIRALGPGPSSDAVFNAVSGLLLPLISSRPELPAILSCLEKDLPASDPTTSSSNDPSSNSTVPPKSDPIPSVSPPSLSAAQTNSTPKEPDTKTAASNSSPPPPGLAEPANNTTKLASSVGASTNATAGSLPDSIVGNESSLDPSSVDLLSTKVVNSTSARS